MSFGRRWRGRGAREGDDWEMMGWDGELRWMLEGEGGGEGR